MSWSPSRQVTGASHLPSPSEIIPSVRIGRNSRSPSDRTSGRTEAPEGQGHEVSGPESTYIVGVQEIPSSIQADAASLWGAASLWRSGGPGVGRGMESAGSWQAGRQGPKARASICSAPDSSMLALTLPDLNVPYSVKPARTLPHKTSPNPPLYSKSGNLLITVVCFF